MTGGRASLTLPGRLLVKQWKQIWTRARPTAGAYIILGGFFGFLAYREKPSSVAFKLYTTSAALLTSIVPYTLALMGTTNKKLLEKSDSLASAAITDAAAEAGIAKEETV